MDTVVLDHLRTWIGNSRSDEDVISVRQARLMAATVDYAPEEIRDGKPLPPLWHWIYFLEGLPTDALGRDGHPARGGFLPPVPLSNRMWAGGRVSFLRAIPLGITMRKVSRILGVEHKQGRAGDLVFVTVEHELISLSGEVCVREEHDIVYKAATPFAPAPPPTCREPAGRWMSTCTPTSTTLFRYSALTFNGHRIHYDSDYCREVEGYPNLVIHGPLNATLLANFAEQASGGRVREFHYRGLSPAILGETMTLHADLRGASVVLRIELASGAVCMRAEAQIG